MLAKLRDPGAQIVSESSIDLPRSLKIDQVKVRLNAGRGARIIVWIRTAKMIDGR